MKKAIIGKKLGMTQVFTPEGAVIPVTVVEAGPCPVVQVKNNEKDGYEAVVVAFDKQKAQRVNKPRTGAFKKAGVDTYRVLKEFRFDNSADSDKKSKQTSLLRETRQTLQAQLVVVDLPALSRDGINTALR